MKETVTIKQVRTGWIVFIGKREYTTPGPLSVARAIARTARADIKRGIKL